MEILVDFGDSTALEHSVQVLSCEMLGAELATEPHCDIDVAIVNCPVRAEEVLQETGHAQVIVLCLSDTDFSMSDELATKHPKRVRRACYNGFDRDGASRLEHILTKIRDERR